MNDISNKKTKYDHMPIEKKWIEQWYKNNIYEAIDFSSKPKKYILAEFPYPSGSKLHVGHAMRYTVPDIYSRKLRMCGFNVMFPMGWDAFGLPAENNAVRTGIHPAISTKEAISTYKEQIKSMGFGMDWSREISTIDPEYYKWTQFLFLKFFEHGLAEIKEEPVWWADNLKTVLANEEVITDANGNLVAERDGKSTVERRMLRQWVLKIPKYADKLIEGLEKIDFPESIKSAQINWIGRSEGAEIDFGNINKQKIRIFTTRLDTIYGATFIVLAPEHHLVDELTTDEQEQEIESYIEETKQKTELDRLSDTKVKTGVFTGSFAKNPFTGKEIPIWVSDFVLTTYGTGAIMGVPAHDGRDFAFAKKFGIEVIKVIEPINQNESELEFYTSKEGKLINSGAYNGLGIKDAFEKFIIAAEKDGFGERKVHYKLRDWLFSRQRYWGEPIPLIHKEDGTIEAIVTTQNNEEVNRLLPLILPEVPDYTPSSDASSPLSKNANWVQTYARDGSNAKRETNTMPNWAGSCWYYLRYIDPKNTDTFADFDKMKYWLPVDRYFGGSEHTTLHLLYSRFWHKFFYDLGIVPTEEPYQWRMNGGTLLGPDGQKMSKSIGNVLNPDEKIAIYGADALRLYICFMGPYDGTITWQEGGLKACRRLVEEIIELNNKLVDIQSDDTSNEFMTAYHKLIKNVTRMIDDLKMNTAVSEIMIFVNLAKRQNNISLEIWKGFLKVIAPFAPFIAEELWQQLHSDSDGNSLKTGQKEYSIHLQDWPIYDEAKIKEDKFIVGVQINGKLRAEVEVNIDENAEIVRNRVMTLPSVQKWTEGTEPKKFIYIPGKIVNIVI